MCRIRCRTVVLYTLVMALAVSVVLVLPATAAAIEPITSIAFDPASPDGNYPWWLTPPLVYLSSSQDGELHHAWDGGVEQTSAVSGGVWLGVGEATEGVHTLAYYSVNGAGEPESPNSFEFRCDFTSPSQPGTFTVTRQPGSGYALAWEPSSDGVSGMYGYVVYRNSIGPQFGQQDEVAFTTGTSYLDLPPTIEGEWYYSVGALDVAGNLSALAQPVGLMADLNPPTVPEDVQAWSNAGGGARVSWTPSIDEETWVQAYLVYRSSGGGPFSQIASVAAPATYLDDPAPLGDAPVVYYVIAVDSVGLESGASMPAGLQDDVTPPATPGVTVAPRYDPPGGGSYFSLGSDMAPVAISDDGDYEFSWGPDEAASQQSTLTPRPFVRPDPGASIDATQWYFKTRRWDRAGNVSPWSEVVPARHVTVTRTAGYDRYANAVAISRSTFSHVTTVVVASGAVYSDALSASSLAGALSSPVLLVGPGAVRSDVAAEVARLGATDAYVVGGPGTVSGTTLASLDGLLAGGVTRVSGADRYSTAAQVAQRSRAIRGEDPFRAFVVSGLNYPDALSVASVSYAKGWPVLFATSTSVPSATRKTVASGGITAVTVVGGSGSVTTEAEHVLPVDNRVSGADRYVVSREFCKWAIQNGFADEGYPCVASGAVFPDGLAAGPKAGSRGSFVLLTSAADVPKAAKWFESTRPWTQRVTVVGGTGTLSESVRYDLWESLSRPDTV